MDDTGTILLEEDNPNDGESTCATLGENRPILKISAPNDGREAPDYLCCPGAHRARPAAKPAMVLLDLKLREVDGLEVSQRSKTDPNVKAVLGMDAYVVRPMSYEGFIEAIRKVGPFQGTLDRLPSTTVHDQ